jgi:hypothetical protein
MAGRSGTFGPARRGFRKQILAPMTARSSGLPAPVAHGQGTTNPALAVVRAGDGDSVQRGAEHHTRRPVAGS